MNQPATKIARMLSIAVPAEELALLARRHDRDSRTRHAFWTLFAYFADPELSLVEIAGRIRVSRQRAHQIYGRWFSRIFPERNKKRPAPPVVFKIEGKARMLWDHIKELRAQGGIPASVKLKGIRRRNGTWHKSMIQIQTTKKTLTCLCVVVSGIHQYGSPTVYCRLETRASQVEGVDFVLVLHTAYGNDPLCFVLPVAHVLGRAKPPNGAISLYLPLRRYKYSTSPHYKYRNAWYLLEEGS